MTPYYPKSPGAVESVGGGGWGGFSVVIRKLCCTYGVNMRSDAASSERRTVELKPACVTAGNVSLRVSDLSARRPCTLARLSTRITPLDGTRPKSGHQRLLLHVHTVGSYCEKRPRDEFIQNRHGSFERIKHPVRSSA